MSITLALFSLFAFLPTPTFLLQRPPLQLIERVTGALQQIQHNKCFAQVLQKSLSLTECKEMTEDDKTKIALAFTQCHYERHGRGPLPCEQGRPFNECTSALSSEQWSSFTLFLSHVDSLCFYIRAINWENEQFKLMNLLISHAVAASDRLASILASSEDLLEAQRLINFELIQGRRELQQLGSQLTKQRELLQGLQNEVTISAANIKQLILETEKETVSFLSTILGGINDLKSFQNILFGELQFISSLIFYSLTFCYLFIMTSFESTTSSRPRVLLLYGVYILLFQRIILGHVLSYSLLDPGYKRSLVNLTRVVFLFCQSGLILLNSAQYVNYSEEAVRLLRDGLPDSNETPEWFKKYKLRRISKSVAKTIRAGAKKIREALQ